LLEKLQVPFTKTDSPGLGTVAVTEKWFATPIVDTPGASADWVAWFRVVNQDGQPVIAEVRLLPSSGEHDELEPGQWSIEALGVSAPAPAGGITSRLLRHVRLPFPGAFFVHPITSGGSDAGEEVFPRIFKHEPKLKDTRSRA